MCVIDVDLLVCIVWVCVERNVGNLIVLDGSGSRDDNGDDVLSYTWTVTPREDYSGIDWELVTDSASPFAYLRFHADAGSEDVEWIFDANLVVSDGIFTSEVDAEGANVTAVFFRPTFLSRIDCGHAVPEKPGVALLLLAGLGLLGVRRRRG